MKPTTELHESGQSLWRDNVTCFLTDDDTLHLISNPTLFHHPVAPGSTNIKEATFAGFPINAPRSALTGSYHAWRKGGAI